MGEGTLPWAYVSTKGKHPSPVRFNDDYRHPREAKSHDFPRMEARVAMPELRSSMTCSNGRLEGSPGWGGGASGRRKPHRDPDIPMGLLGK